MARSAFNRAVTSADTTKALQYMVAQVGKPYIWGGNGPNGYDCSGIAYGAWRAIGGQPNHRFTTYSLMNYGTAVSKTGPFAPGDAILPSPGHVVWYIGNGKVVNFPGRGKVGRIDAVPTRIYAVRRIAPPGAPVNVSGDVTGGIPVGYAPATSVTDLAKLAEPLAGFFEAATSPTFWVRMGMVLGGILLILGGLNALIVGGALGKVGKIFNG